MAWRYIRAFEPLFYYYDFLSLRVSLPLIIICVFRFSAILLFYGSAILCVLLFTTLHIMRDSSSAFQTIWFSMLYAGDFYVIMHQRSSIVKGSFNCQSRELFSSWALEARVTAEINDALGERNIQTKKGIFQSGRRMCSGTKGWRKRKRKNKKKIINSVCLCDRMENGFPNVPHSKDGKKKNSINCIDNDLSLSLSFSLAVEVHFPKTTLKPLTKRFQPNFSFSLWRRFPKCDFEQTKALT